MSTYTPKKNKGIKVLSIINTVSIPISTSKPQIKLLRTKNLIHKFSGSSKYRCFFRTRSSALMNLFGPAALTRLKANTCAP